MAQIWLQPFFLTFLHNSIKYSPLEGWLACETGWKIHPPPSDLGRSTPQEENLFLMAQSDVDECAGDFHRRIRFSKSFGVLRHMIVADFISHYSFNFGT